MAVSAATGQGLDDLQDAVIEMLGADFADAAIETDAGNGKVLAYLAAHAEIYRQEYRRQPRRASAAICRGICCTTSRGRT